MSITSLCRLVFNAAWTTEPSHAHIRDLAGRVENNFASSIRLICAVALSLSVISCGGGGSGGDSTPTPVAPPVAEIASKRKSRLR